MKALRVSGESKVDLSRWDADDTSALPGLSKDSCGPRLDAVRQELRELQGVLMAERKHKVLIVLQAMDAGGKDGTVRNAFFGLNPHGLCVAAFKAPTPVELDHDFLWRVHQRAPGRGEMAIFNRSHYEDIVAVRVKRLAPKEVWERRYEHVINFEKLLYDEGTLILKFFLHIDQAEQKKRLEGRLKDPTKLWKIDPHDLRDRQRWGEFSRAYEEVLQRTSTGFAPWFIIPANKKWFRNLVVATIVRDGLAELKMEFPALHPELAGVNSV
ncbi:MAG: PPK2 family polyphosphate kinase [Verrucomicrobiales bacterium]